MSQNIETFGKYILLERVAMGGMAEVYLAKNQGASGIAKFVAIKRILPQYSEQTEFVDMFKEEARIAVNLAHSNIVSINEFGVEKGQFFLAMDFVDGRNLRQILNKMKKTGVAFSIEQVLYIVKEAAAGLDHAHRCLDGTTGKPLNIIHRDISPQNIMVTFEGEVKIVDFGIAKAETQLEVTRAGTLKGKFGYMSPEQAEEQSLDLRTDVFSLGIVLWEMLANDRLFIANNEINTLRKIRDCQIPSLRKINPNIPPELERIVSKALAKDRNLRYQTAAAFHRELSRFLNRQYPDFSPHDFSVFIKTLFAGEILESRKKQIEYAKIEMGAAQAPAPQPVFNPDKTVVTNTSPSYTENTEGAPHDFGPPDRAAQQPVRQQAPKPSEPKPRVQQPQAQQARAPEIPRTPDIPPTPDRRPQPPPPKVGFKRNSEPEIDTYGLSVDSSSISTHMGVRENSSIVGEGSFSGVQQGTYYGTRSISRTNLPSSRFASPASLIIMLLAVGISLGGGVYLITNPGQALSQFTALLERAGVYKRPLGDSGKTDLGSESPSVAVMVPIASTPPAAEILVDDKPYGELTPATLELMMPRKGPKHVKITLRLAGYDSFEQEIDLETKPSVNAVLKSNRFGYLDITVIGAGQIFVNGNKVADGSPANGIAVPIDQEALVRAFDPATNATDERAVRVAEGKVQKITLIPRAPRTRPDPTQSPVPTQNQPQKK